MAEVLHTTIEHLSFRQQEYVLVLPGWYPTSQDPYPGDFNQRHVFAVSAFVPQLVLYISRDLTGQLEKIETEYRQVDQNVIEIICTYPAKKIRAWDKLYSNSIFFHLLWERLNEVHARFGKPVLVHGYIVLRGGLAAAVIKRWWRIPVVLTENWTVYYPSDPGYLRKRNFVFRQSVRFVFRKINRYLPVTNDLAIKTEQLIGKIPYTVIPNVVDTLLFTRLDDIVHKPVFTFVHVSTMSYQKNPEGLIDAYRQFSTEHANTRLLMVGPYPEKVFEYARAFGSKEKSIHFTGPVSYLQVAEILKKSDVIVLFSRYENLPCVVLEALCCGLPVISSDVGGLKEVINRSNGILVKSDDKPALAEAMAEVFRDYSRYDSNEIAEKSSRLFSYQTVGAAIKRVYEELLHRQF